MPDVEIGGLAIPDASTLDGSETVTLRQGTVTTKTTAAELAALLRDPAVVDDGNIVWDDTAAKVTTESQAMFASRVLQALNVSTGDGEYLLKGTGGPALPPSSGTAWTPADFTDGTIPLAKLEAVDIATTAQVEDSTADINLAPKFAGRQIWHSTGSRPLFASGSAATDPWVLADGTTAHTPT